ncbi:MAG: AAA family ATPase, partial [Planctomycetes bacterium]|nr:AAA family ATPase [Planctomycetota bacterium]
LAQKSRELQSAAHAAQEAQDAHEAQVAMLAKELAARDADVGCLAQKLTEALVEVGRRSERRAAGAEAVGELRARLERLCQALSQAEREAEEAAEQIETAELELDAARTRRSEVARECERHQAEVLRLRENRHELRQRLETARAAARALHGQIEELDAALRECEVALRETEVRKENLVARVQDDLALDLAALYASYEHEEQDWEAIKEEIEDLRQKIARLGNINLDALAELDELSPRYDNLIAQRDDLEASVARLEALIVELDEASRARFAATFEEVRVQFQELFRKLFGGGKADIILEDPEQPLECGIEIIARPPGKEPQSISLLSGGERTMTAVALLLAIFKSKPSPFAILDEVDAALDESNIERFNNVLQEFLTHSQFIVITHNKRTMQCADMLYGVTMEELGVSKRVSVRFDGCVETPHVA